MLEAIDLQKRFGRTVALDGACLSVSTGEIVAIVGPSGSGKSTLLHCAAGILRPDAGEVVFEGRRVDALGEAARSELRRTAFGFVFQFGQLVPELTSAENIALPLMLSGTSRRGALREARRWLTLLDLVEAAQKRPGELSGGEGQRGAVLGVFAATAVLVYLPSHDRWLSQGDLVANYVAPTPIDATVEVHPNGAPRARADALGARLAATPGVRKVLPGAEIDFRRAGYGATAVFATCTDAGVALHQKLACPAHGVLVSRATRLHVGDTIRIRGVRTTVGGFLPNAAVSAVVPPGAVAPPHHPETWLLETNGSLATAQRVRAAQTASGLLGYVSSAADDAVPGTARDPLRRQAELVVALMLSIAGCSLVVMMIEGIVERRRELAMLAAAGTRPRDLRSSVALEIVIPLAVASIASCVIGVVVTATLLRVRGIDLVVPWANLGQLLAVTVVIGAAVLALGLPMLARAIRADNLRTE